MYKLISFFALSLLSISFWLCASENNEKASAMVEAYKATILEDKKIFKEMESSSEPSEKAHFTPLKSLSALKQNQFDLRRKHKRNIFFEWPEFAKDFGYEKFIIQFPVPPSVADDGFNITFIASDTTTFPAVVYGITFHSPPIVGANPTVVFNNVIAARSCGGSVIAGYQTNYCGGYWTLDILSLNTITGFYQQERVVVTPFDVYFLFSLFYPNSVPQYEAFFNSFQLFQ